MAAASPQPSCPPILYKYLSAHNAIRTISEHRIKVSQPDTFNDPFEIGALYTGDIDLALIVDLILRPGNLDEMYASPNPPTQPRAAFIHLLKTNPGQIIDAASQQRMRANAQEDFAKAKARMFALCLSKVSDDLLMWAHYADEHQGIVIGFTTEGWGTKEAGFMPVRYQKDRATIPMNLGLSNSDPDKREAAYRTAYTTKSPHWCYEQEWRIFFKPRGTAFQGIRTANGDILFFYIFPIGQVREIIFGQRCPAKEILRMKQAAIAAGATHCRFSQVSLHATRFELEIKDSI